MVNIGSFNKTENKKAVLPIFAVMIVFICYNVYTSVDAIEFNINIDKHTSNSNNCDGKVLCIGKSGTIISSNIDEDEDDFSTSVVDINNDNKTIVSNSTSFHFSQ